MRGICSESYKEQKIMIVNNVTLIEGFTLFCVHVTLSAVCRKKIRHHAVGGQTFLL